MAPPTKVIVTGAAGRMGKRLIALAHESPNIQIAGATEAEGHPDLGKDAGELAGYGNLGISITDDLPRLLSQADVVVDFTAPGPTLNHLAQVAQLKRAIVIGTTGFSPDEMKQLRKHAESIPCVQAPNMSMGINVLLKIIGKVAQALGDDYNLEIIDTHHNGKKDAPSGTALKLAEALASAKNWDLAKTGMYARHGIIGERPSKEIGIQTVRAGDIVGDHTILYGGPGERIEITHRAQNRDPFARGALRAAEWVVNQPPGFYGMADVLNL
jgi:4-hydroxy-tetrahydrodipicolinate reductase